MQNYSKGSSEGRCNTVEVVIAIHPVVCQYNVDGLQFTRPPTVHAPFGCGQGLYRSAKETAMLTLI